MVKLPSASRMGLAMKCAGSVLLPQVVSEPGIEAQEGTKIHATLEKYFKAGRSCEGLDAEVAANCERVSRTIGIHSWEYSELGLWIDPNDWSAGCYLADRVRDSFSVCRQLPSVVYSRPIHGSKRDVLASYGGPDGGGIFGPMSLGFEQWRSSRYVAVADLVGKYDSCSFSIWDWKSGGSVPEAKYNWQLLVPAVAIWIICGRPDEFSVRLGIAYVSDMVRKSGASASASDHILDAAVNDRQELCATSEFVATSDDCARALDQLRRRHAEFEHHTPETVTLYQGKHCAFCPARHRCPAVRSALAGIGSSDDVGLVRTSRTLIDHGYQLRQMEIAILKEHGGELDLGDGRIAVLTKDWRKKDKVYTKRAKQERSNASETNLEGTKDGGDSSAE